tara:strand:- start:13 stop:192 length:180 start_codon:yes stop_codon:yes gene_type:complete
MEDRFDTIPEASSDIQIQLTKNGGAKCTTQTEAEVAPNSPGAVFSERLSSILDSATTQK